MERNSRKLARVGNMIPESGIHTPFASFKLLCGPGWFLASSVLRMEVPRWRLSRVTCLFCSGDE